MIRVHLEEGCFYISQTKHVEDETDNIDGYDRHQRLRNAEIEHGYLDLGCEQCTNME